MNVKMLSNSRISTINRNVEEEKKTNGINKEKKNIYKMHVSDDLISNEC